MEISAINMRPNLSYRQSPELISGNCGQEEQAVQQKQDWSETMENEQPDIEQVKAAVEQINKTLSLHSTRLEFSIHDKTNEILVKVVDADTGELIREVPAARTLDMVAMTWEELGLLVDEKA